MKRNTKVRKGNKLNNLIWNLIVGVMIIWTLYMVGIHIIQTQTVEASNYGWNIYYVSNGDRLWDIAEQQNSNKDIREIIYIIKQDNGLEKSDLQINQELMLRTEY